MPRCCDGFTLIESIVALGLVVVVALGSAQLFGLAIARNLWARDQLAMSLLASSKINDLAAAALDGTLVLSPTDTLDRSVDGWADTAVEAGRAYVRRWHISRVPGFADDAVAIAIRVAPAAGPGELRLATIREWRHP